MEEKDTLFENTLRSAIEKLSILEPGSEEYKRQAEAVKCLMDSYSDSKEREVTRKEHEKDREVELQNQKTKNRTLLIQTAVTVGIGLVELLLVIGFEKTDVFRLKEALKYVFKPRV